MSSVELTDIVVGDPNDNESLHQNFQDVPKQELVEVLSELLHELRQLRKSNKDYQEKVVKLQRRVEELRPCCVVRCCCRLKLCMLDIFPCAMNPCKWLKRSKKINNNTTTESV